eukprot:scaffold101267_cov21-Cyclotella_meneghiniana.AAC.1
MQYQAAVKSLPNPKICQDTQLHPLRITTVNPDGFDSKFERVESPSTFRIIKPAAGTRREALSERRRRQALINHTVSKTHKRIRYSQYHRQATTHHIIINHSMFSLGLRPRRVQVRSCATHAHGSNIIINTYSNIHSSSLQLINYVMSVSQLNIQLLLWPSASSSDVPICDRHVVIQSVCYFFTNTTLPLNTDMPSPTNVGCDSNKPPGLLPDDEAEGPRRKTKCQMVNSYDI